LGLCGAVAWASPERSSTPAGSTVADSGVALPALEADAAVFTLSVPPFRDAAVAVPIGATKPRPVIVAMHGNYDRPEWQCEVWHGISKGFAFVLCPRGIPRPDAPPPLDRWTYGKAADVRREIDAGLDALRARFPAHVAPGPILYAGFSLGAIVGVGIISQDPNRFPRAVLIEGGHTMWTRDRARAYASGGLRRILFACGQRSCKGEAAEVRPLLEREGVEVRVVYGDERAHTYDGKVADAIAPEFPWLTEGDARWAASGN
jgi:predicted esterase